MFLGGLLEKFLAIFLNLLFMLLANLGWIFNLSSLEIGADKLLGSLKRFSIQLVHQRQLITHFFRKSFKVIFGDLALVFVHNISNVRK